MDTRGLRLWGLISFGAALRCPETITAHWCWFELRCTDWNDFIYPTCRTPCALTDAVTGPLLLLLRLRCTHSCKTSRRWQLKTIIHSMMVLDKVQELLQKVIIHHLSGRAHVRFPPLLVLFLPFVCVTVWTTQFKNWIKSLESPRLEVSAGRGLAMLWSMQAADR